MTRDKFDKFMKQVPKGATIGPSAYVSDWASVKRTRRERLFSLPWQPFKKRKFVPQQIAYIGESFCLVSYKTWSELTPFLSK